MFILFKIIPDSLNIDSWKRAKSRRFYLDSLENKEEYKVEIVPRGRQDNIFEKENLDQSETVQPNG